MKHVNPPLENKSSFVCELCGKSFKTSSSLKKHQYIHLPDSKPYQCKICPRKYACKSHLKIHVMRHEGIRNHVCILCGMRTTTAHSLKIHMNYHTKEEQYPCEVIIFFTFIYEICNSIKEITNIL